MNGTVILVHETRPSPVRGVCARTVSTRGAALRAIRSGS